MARSRSRSRSRKERRKRDSSRDRDKDREKKKRNRSRSPRDSNKSPRRHKSSHRHRSRDDDDEVIYTGTSHVSELPVRNKKLKNKPVVEEKLLENMDEEEVQMMQTMGFALFNTTKGKKVDGNDTYSANLVHKRKYRQYMNRRGGFNRPLDFVA